VHRPRDPSKVTDPAKHSPVGGGVVFAADRDVSINLPVEPRKVRAWVLAFMEGQTTGARSPGSTSFTMQPRRWAESPDQAMGAGLSPWIPFAMARG
jgi:hypothetical protein